ncbi:uncharacterized protein LOC142353319 isoform X2 [Convolutriloba macropyga]|uniref:uncharacterized protein LOC142353319 isoform X2 n=1 Tax=Convolutriloba macropyga TaxID=536237 RepID=UPI003F523DC0
MDFDSLRAKQVRENSSSPGLPVSSANVQRHSSTGSLFGSASKGEVQKEWRSAVDGSVITSSAKVGIAVAQQRAPPVNQDSASATGLPPSSTSPSSAYYTAAAAAAAAQNQLSLQSSLMNATNSAAAASASGQATLDLNSLQQQLLYNQTMANLPLSLPTAAASLQPTIPFPVTYWPAMALPSPAAAAVSYQALNNLLRSSSTLNNLNNAAAVAAAASAAAAYHPSLLSNSNQQQQAAGGAAAALSALGAAASLPITSSAAAANFDPFLAVATSQLNSVNSSTEWSERSRVSPSPSTLSLSANASCSETTGTAAGQHADSQQVSALFSSAPELGKVFAYNRKTAVDSRDDSIRGVSDTTLPLSVVTTTSSTGSSFGKTLGYVRRHDSYAENSSSREQMKSDAPKINLPTKSVTIPAESLKELSNRPPSSNSVSSENTPKASPRSSTPPTTHLSSGHSSDVLLPAKWRCKTSFPKTDTPGSDIHEPTIRKQPTPDQGLDTTSELEFKYSFHQKDETRSATPRSIEESEPPRIVIEPIVKQQSEIKVKSEKVSALGSGVNGSLATQSTVTTRPPGPNPRGRPRETREPSTTSNYLKCISDVIDQCQKYSMSEERRSELWEFCRRVPDHDFPDPARSSVSPGSSKSSKSPVTENSFGKLNSSSSLYSHAVSNRASNFAFDPSEFGSASSLHHVTNNPSGSISSSIRNSDISSSNLYGRSPSGAACGSTGLLRSDDDDEDDDDYDDESGVSSDSTICPESPPLVISYTKETLNEFCTRQYQSLLEDVEQPLKQVLSYEDEDTAAKRKLIVLEQRVKRKLKMKFAGFDSEAKRKRLEESSTMGSAAGDSSLLSSSTISENHSQTGSRDSIVGVDRRLPNQQITSTTCSSQSQSSGSLYRQKSPSATKVLQRKSACQPPSSSSSSTSGAGLHHPSYTQISPSHSTASISHQTNKSNLHSVQTTVETVQHVGPSSSGNSRSVSGNYTSLHSSQSSQNSSAGASQRHRGQNQSHLQGMNDQLRVSTSATNNPSAVADSRRSVHLTNDDLVSGQRILLRQSDGLFAPGKLIAMKPPDIYGILVDGARGSKPQIFAYEDLVNRAVLEIVPRTKSAIPKGTKVCAHYSKSFTVLHPGTVSTSNTKTLPHAVKIDFEDGDESIVNLCDVRVLSSLFNPTDYNILNPTYSPNAVSSSLGSPGSSQSNRGRKVSIWKWDRKCLTETPLSKNIKSFFSSISKSNAVVNKGDFVAFHNSAAQVSGSTGNTRRPYIGHVINFFETSTGECVVKVSWYYRMEETKQGGDRKLPKNALLRSSHSDELDIQTISHKVEVLDDKEYADHNHNIYKAAQAKGTYPDNLFVCAGTYDHTRGVAHLTYKKPPANIYSSANITAVSPVAPIQSTSLSPTDVFSASDHKLDNDDDDDDIDEENKSVQSQSVLLTSIKSNNLSYSGSSSNASHFS